ncbi:MAG: TetR family transcriptional regulator C-terminal domain-containing protein [Pseudomonadota bacterium]
MAAIDSISKRGFSDTTLKHVTQKAKLSHGVVNYHFESKEALYNATLGYLAKEHYELWVESQQKVGDDPAEQLAAIVEADFDKKVCTSKKLAVWFAFWGQAKYRPNYLKIHSKYDEERFLEIGRLCETLIEQGGYTKLDSNEAARTIESFIDGLWLSLMLYPSDAKRIQCRNDCFRTLGLLFPKHFENYEMLPGRPCDRN